MLPNTERVGAITTKTCMFRLSQCVGVALSYLEFVSGSTSLTSFDDGWLAAVLYRFVVGLPVCKHQDHIRHIRPIAGPRRHLQTTDRGGTG